MYILEVDFISNGMYTCPKCNGKGEVTHDLVDSLPCWKCERTGKVPYDSSDDSEVSRYFSAVMKGLLESLESEKRMFAIEFPDYFAKMVKAKEDETGKCPKCNGQKKIYKYRSIQDGKCFTCNGTGRVRFDTKRLKGFNHNEYSPQDLPNILEEIYFIIDKRSRLEDLK